MKLVGGIPGPNGRFVKGGKSHGGPGRKFGACMVGDKPLTRAEKVKRHAMKYPERVKATKERWRKNNPEAYRAEKRRGLLKKYGLTIETYNAMWEAQGRKCAICRSSDPYTPKGWQVDHCHSTGLARGILCTHCNRMLAGAVDKAEHLIEGVKYLAKYVRSA